MDLKERKQRVIARGEHSDHAHVAIGENVQVSVNADGSLSITTGNSPATLMHLIESEWLQGRVVRAKERHDGDGHDDVAMNPNTTYKYIPQIEYDPYNDIIIASRD